MDWIIFYLMVWYGMVWYLVDLLEGTSLQLERWRGGREPRRGQTWNQSINQGINQSNNQSNNQANNPFKNKSNI